MSHSTSGDLVITTEKDNIHAFGLAFVRCPQNGDCNVTCYGEYSCTSLHVLGALGPNNNLYLTGFGEGVLQYSVVYCPLNDPGDVNCFITVSGNIGDEYMMDEMQIVAVNAFADVEITCNWNDAPENDCYWTVGGIYYPQMVCGTYYNNTCDMELVSGYDEFECRDNSSVCNIYEITQTAEPTRDPTQNPS